LNTSLRPLALVVLLALIVGCSDDDDKSLTDPGGGGLDTFEKVIDNAGQYADPTEFHTVDVLGTEEDYRDDGSVWTCTTRQVSLQEAPGAFFLASSVADIWPGALMQGATLENDPPSRVRADRGGGSVVINLFTGESETNYVDLPMVSESRVKQAVNDIIADRTLFPSQFQFSFESVESEEDLRVTLDMKVETFASEIEGNLSFNSEYDYNRYVVKLIQPFYEISFEAPNTYDEFFAPDVDPADLVADMAPGNPPVYIRSVKYGRIVYILVESTSSLTEMEASLRGTYEAAVTNVEIEAGVEYVNQLDNVRVQATVYGGEMSIANLTGDFDDLKSALNDQQSIALALPLSYNLEDLRTGQPIRVKLATEYTVRHCEPVSAGLTAPLAIWDTENMSQAAHMFDNFHASSGLIGGGIMIFSFPSLLATGLPDISGNDNHLSFGAWNTRPQVLDDPEIDGNVIQFRTTGGIAGAWLIPLDHQRTYATFSGTVLEDRDYTIFAVLAAPSSVRTWYWLSANYDETAVPNSPGWFMAGETQNSAQRDLRFGFNGQQNLQLTHADGVLAATSPSATSAYQVYTARFSRENGMSLFVNGELVGNDPALLNEIIALSGGKLGAAHPSQFDYSTHSFLRMRLVEIYDGAIGDETIATHASGIRQGLGI